MDKTAQALLYLMRCALQDLPPKPIDGLDYEALYNLSVFHSVAAMTAMALESGGAAGGKLCQPGMYQEVEGRKG